MKVCDVCMKPGDLKEVECKLSIFSGDPSEGDDITRLPSSEVCERCIKNLKWTFDTDVKKISEFKQINERYYDALWSK